MKNNPAPRAMDDQKATEPSVLKEPWRAPSTGRICSHNVQI